MICRHTIDTTLLGSEGANLDLETNLLARLHVRSIGQSPY